MAGAGVATPPAPAGATPAPPEDTAMGQNDDSTSTEDTSGSGDEPLGAGGIKALEAERNARREAERRAAAAENRARELELANERRDVAAAKGLTADQAKYLTGDSREALEEAADGLLAAFGAATKDDDRPAGGRAASRPREALRGGASNPDDREVGDAGKVADSILSSGI